MRLIRNLRTGKTAAYDAELVESGRWVEVTEEPKQKEKPKKGIHLKPISAKATLEVSETEPQKAQ